MNIEIISGPLIGMVIGYFTNYLAVKMLFRPYHPIKIGKKVLPFTQGIIPKEKERLAESIGTMVGNTLLSEELLNQAFLSEEMKQRIRCIAEETLKEWSARQETIADITKHYVGVEIYEEKYIALEDYITDKIVWKLIEIDLGTIISNEAQKYIKDKLKDNFFSKFMKQDKMSGITDLLAHKINSYMEENGKNIVEPQVKEELKKLADIPICQIADKLEDNKEIYISLIIRIYEQFITEKMSDILQNISIPDLIRKKITEMELSEVENMILSVMKKELNVVVNLGAVIGFVLGIINIFL